MGNMKNLYFDEFYNEFGVPVEYYEFFSNLEYDKPLWHKASGSKRSDIKRDSGDSSKTNNKSGNAGTVSKDGQKQRLIVDSKGRPEISTKFYDDVWAVAEEAVDVLLTKHQDYGSSNIAEAPGGAVNGLAVRLHDKVARLSNLIKTGVDPKHESLYDTFLDIANYGIIGMLVLSDCWDTSE